jgi:hypothetical protein
MDYIEGYNKTHNLGIITEGKVWVSTTTRLRIKVLYILEDSIVSNLGEEVGNET